MCVFFGGEGRIKYAKADNKPIFHLQCDWTASGNPPQPDPVMPPRAYPHTKTVAKLVVVFNVRLVPAYCNSKPLTSAIQTFGRRA